MPPRKKKQVAVLTIQKDKPPDIPRVSFNFNGDFYDMKDERELNIGDRLYVKKYPTIAAAATDDDIAFGHLREFFQRTFHDVPPDDLILGFTDDDCEQIVGTLLDQWTKQRAARLDSADSDAPEVE